MRISLPADLLILLASLPLSVPAWGNTIFVSAPPGASGLAYSDPALYGSLSIGAAELLGMPFQISTPTYISAAGGYLVAANTDPWFAAIVPLSVGRYGFLAPSGHPFDSSTIATSLFTPGLTTGDYVAEFDTTLQPGWYGLVIGAGYFGSPSTAGGLLVVDGSGSPPPMFGWDYPLVPDPNWDGYGGSSDFRMLVEGAPEPGACSFVVLGLASIGLLRPWRRQTHEHTKFVLH